MTTSRNSSFRTLADVTSLPSTIRPVNNTVTIDGALSRARFIVSLRSPDSDRTLREQSCVRFSPRELPTIDDIPNHTDRFCDISEGVNSEGRMLLIESHRCYTADWEVNASALKVWMDIHYFPFRSPLEYRDFTVMPSSVATYLTQTSSPSLASSPVISSPTPVSLNLRAWKTSSNTLQIVPTPLD